MGRDKRNIHSLVRLDELIYPLFVKKGIRQKESVPSMPNIYKYSPSQLVKEAAVLKKNGIQSVLLFGQAEKKSSDGKEAYREGNVVSEVIRLLKTHVPGLTIITDICVCPYTSHGHCGVISKNKTKLEKRATLKALSAMALSHARAGADYVAPSAMARWQVHSIRKTLDKAGYRKVKIMGYSAKFASNFYGPFRHIADSAPKFGDRRAYQLDYTHRKTALRKVSADIREGADIVMVKPALGYLDVVRDVRNRFKKPLAAYNVSGEYTMVKHGAKLGLWKEKEMVLEMIGSLKRAGADYVITYHAKDIARWVHTA